MDEERLSHKIPCLWDVVIHPSLASSANIRSSWYVCSVRTTSRCLFSACPPGTFGADCTLTCRCPADDVCDGVTGLCQGGVCLYGWDGPACQLREWKSIDLIAGNPHCPILWRKHVIAWTSHYCTGTCGRPTWSELIIILNLAKDTCIFVL